MSHFLRASLTDTIVPYLIISSGFCSVTIYLVNYIFQTRPKNTLKQTFHLIRVSKLEILQSVIITYTYIFFLLLGKKGMEAHNHPNFVHTKSIKLPKECYKNDTSCLVGQLAFADFDLDGQLDLIFPVCHDGTTCANSTIYFSSASKLMQVSYWFFSYRLWAPLWRL